MRLGKLAAVTFVATIASFAVSYATAPKAENGKTKPYPFSILGQWKDIKVVSKFSGGGNEVSINKRISAESVERLNIHVEAGNILLNSNDSNVVSINLSGNFSSENPLVIEESSGELTIRVEEESVFGNSHGTLDISLPMNVRELSVATVSGEIGGKLPPLRSFNLATVSGGLKLDDLAIPVVKVASVSGDVDLSGRLASLNLVSVSGDIKIRSENPAPAIKINSTSGDVEIEFASAPQATVKFNSMSGDSDFGSDSKIFGDGSGSVVVETVSGDFKLLTSSNDSSGQ